MAAMEEGKIDFVLRLKFKLFETMCHCLIAICDTFFFENAKIWVGRSTLSREKKGDGLTWPSIINYFNDDLELHYWDDT